MPSAESLTLEFLGITVRATTTAPADLRFAFGPHIVADAARPAHASASTLHVDFVDGDPPHVVVRAPDGTPLLNRPYRGWPGWEGVPPPVPPFAVLGSRYVLVQAAVLTRNGTTVALIGSPQSPRARVGLALAQRGWSFVSPQLLVLERDSGVVMPYLAPLELRGEALAELRGTIGTRTPHRSIVSPVSGEVVLVRPEAVAPTARVRAAVKNPVLIRLCRGDDEQARLDYWNFVPAAWPADHAAEALVHAETLRLELPPVGGAEEAAGLVDSLAGGRCTDPTLFPDECEEPCPDAPRTPQATPVGSTASVRT
ncbi:hypothetical protein [Yinghuangia seranimata]|uniref:hypothetical protein n=1 Tax=Yinghuangia seranimata TaxID=408067 RepID=UPI00248C0033|nr:hypothetical protein [Yinghuangia seranimata]MDI2130086.1 hypothetical protein [Yinghuangia seranimata]